MRVIRARNVNDAYAHVINSALASHMDANHGWIRRDSRNGPVMEYMEPVATVYQKPRERVLLNNDRDANPFFHLMEALWILAGRNDVGWISQFNSRIAQYSDDGETFHGAYGHRWRHHFDYYEMSDGVDTDQIGYVIRLLNQSPDSRRAVIAMWDPTTDMIDRKDIPCNTHIYLKIRDDDLHMTVCCRSNDAIWGCYGANAVHFSILQEYVAGCLGVGVGSYTHLSDSLHIYLDNPAWKRHLDSMAEYTQAVQTTVIYDKVQVAITPLIHEASLFDEELTRFMGINWDWADYEEPFFHDVAMPMRKAWDLRKAGLSAAAVRDVLGRIQSADWRIACERWMNKRYLEKKGAGR